MSKAGRLSDASAPECIGLQRHQRQLADYGGRDANIAELARVLPRWPGDVAGGTPNVGLNEVNRFLILASGILLNIYRERRRSAQSRTSQGIERVKVRHRRARGYDSIKDPTSAHLI